MVAVDIAADYEGKPLSVLSDLIRDRQKYLGESAADAVVATGIDALNSLRALTKIAPKYPRKSEYSFQRDYSKAPYLTLKGRRRHDPYGQGISRRWKFTHLPGTADQRTYIRYPYTGRHRGMGGRMIGGDAVAEQNEVLRGMGLRPIKRRGLAKTVLGAMMNELSTRPGRNFAREMERFARGERATMPKGGTFYVHGFQRAQSYTLNLQDRLNYALQALQGGPASIDLALKRAANKIAGRLCKVAERKFGERVATPFPEVKGRRAR